MKPSGFDFGQTLPVASVAPQPIPIPALDNDELRGLVLFAACALKAYGRSKSELLQLTPRWERFGHLDIGGDFVFTIHIGGPLLGDEASKWEGNTRCGRLLSSLLEMSIGFDLFCVKVQPRFDR